jgi:hypothetical protein
LTVQEIASNQMISRLPFEQAADDPARLAVSLDGTTAAVSLQGSNAVAWVDLKDLANPRLISRRAWAEGSCPGALGFDHEGGLLAVDEAEQALWHQAGPNAEPTVRQVAAGVGDVLEIPGEPRIWAMTLPFDSGIGLLPAGSRTADELSLLPIKGRANLAATRPLGLAYCADRRLLAVANRSGGSVHLVALRQAGFR